MNKLKTIIASITSSKKSNKGSNSKNAYIASPSMHTKIRTSGIPYARTIQNFRLVWLDSSIDEVNNDDSINTITKLRQVVNTVKKFTDVDECINFMTNIQDEKIFMICSGELGQTTVPIVHDMAQMNCVYIFCENKAQHDEWAKEWPKVKGVFTDITSIYEALKQAAQECDKNSVSISFIESTDGVSNKNLNKLDQSFMYTKILKEILLTIDFEQEHIDQFLIYCREQFVGNTSELKNVEKLEKEYQHHQPIWWYTYQCFLYSMLNRALRMMEVDLIIKMGFFVRALHNHIVALHSEQYSGQNHSNFIVYRGQGLSQTDFDQLMKTKGGLMSFNNFLSTSRDRAVSFAFAESNQYNSDLIGVLFEITINPSISSTVFASIHNISAYQMEEEILFSMHSIFRVEQVKQIDENNRLWQVDLILTRNKDQQLHALTERMREETFPQLIGWDRLGMLLIKLGYLSKAEELYETLFEQTTNDDAKAHLFHQLGWTKNGQGNYAEAVEFYENSIKIIQKTSPQKHPDLANSYNNIGLAYYNMGKYSKALSYYEKSLKIQQKTLPPTHFDSATSYNNIGLVYDNKGKYLKALSYYEKSLKIQQETLPLNHPDLATSYNNIAAVYDNIGDYVEARSYYAKALRIQQKILPSNHPDLATSYNNIGCLYRNMRNYSKALSYYERALDIFQRSLPPNHPHLQSVQRSIQIVRNCN